MSEDDKPLKLQASTAALRRKIVAMEGKSQHMDALAGTFDRVTALDMEGAINSIKVTLNGKRGISFGLALTEELEREVIQFIMADYRKQMEKLHNEIQSLAKEI